MLIAKIGVTKFIFQKKDFKIENKNIDNIMI